MRYILPSLLLAALPAHAASGPFFSLANTNFTVLIAFVIFIGVLVYFKVPGMLTGMLDKRAAKIQQDLDEARRLREEAKALVASYDRKLKEARDQVERIVANAQADAKAAAEAAKADLARSIARKLQAAEEQIAAAEGSAIREVRERAIAVAIAAAGDVLARQTTGESAAALIDASIAEVGKRLN
ncbi:MAG: ATP F0F1 synthase subunit B [Gemmobacter sp.]|uniref:F0F1 ATP synthase subunit B family protein n=1 Tax=Gemmobacter sp. TaxID=1898957 RepID=UPI00391CF531